MLLTIRYINYNTFMESPKLSINYRKSMSLIFKWSMLILLWISDAYWNSLRTASCDIFLSKVPSYLLSEKSKKIRNLRMSTCNLSSFDNKLHLNSKKEVSIFWRHAYLYSNPGFNRSIVLLWIQTQLRTTETLSSIAKNLDNILSSVPAYGQTKQSVLKTSKHVEKKAAVYWFDNVSYSTNISINSLIN